uniref:Fibronectin type-III domain-containing protein n=1 Tax=Oncorhynchus kisutch TaxID=8019 RepID=A0A8C7JUW2_ONCKI
MATEGEDGSQSRWISATLSTVVPPRVLKIDHLEETSFTLHWSKAEGMQKVPQRFFISNCIPGTDPLTAVTDDCHKIFSNLHPGTEYTVSVATVLSNGEQSEPVSTTVCTILPVPDQLTVDSVDTTSATVSWSQSPGLDHTQHHYQISYRCSGTEPHITTTSSPSITLCDLKPATEYSVTVCTVLENGKQSQLVLTTFTTVLPAPDQLTVDLVDTTSAVVSWSQPPGLGQTQHQYLISYHCPGTEPHITTTSSPSITLSGLQCGTQYSVTVCTVLENGKQSQLVSTTFTTILPAPDQLTVDSVDTTSADVCWNQPPGLDQTQHHYQISYHCPGTEVHITTTSSPSITLSDLQCGTQYSVTVCTVLENGKQSRLVSTTLTTKHLQWWKRPSTVAAVFVLLAVIMGLWDSYATSERDHLQNSLNTRTTERDQLQTSYNTPTKERDQLQTSYNTPTKERDRLQISYNTLTKERDQLQNSLNTWTTERDQLQNSLNTRTTERDQLQTSYNTPTKERDQLQNSYNTPTKERDQLQISYNTLTKERDQLQNSLNTWTTERDQLQNSLNTRTTERDQLQTSYNTLTKERDQLQTSYNTLTKERDQLQSSLNTRTTEIDKLKKSLNTTTMERDQLQKEIERLNWENKGKCVQRAHLFICFLIHSFCS